MTPQDQVKRIIQILSPENPDEQTDAVFLVEAALQKLRAKVHAKDKQIAKLEEELAEARKEALILSNEKRELQASHAKQIETYEEERNGDPLSVELSIEEEPVTQPEANDGEEEEN